MPWKYHTLHQPMQFQGQKKHAPDLETPYIKICIQSHGKN